MAAHEQGAYALGNMIPLPPEFLRALDGRDELLVSSREGAKHGTVRAWFVVGPPGVVYLFSQAFSLKVMRWRSDPWVRLRLPGTAVSVEGIIHFVTLEEVDSVAPLIIERWGMWGATTVEGLRRMLKDGTHVLVRVGGAAKSNSLSGYSAR